MPTDPARRSIEQQLWRCIEALHAVVYFDRSTGDTYREIGLRDFWMGFFASRSAALGCATPQLVTALFHGFAPRMVTRALPDAWSLASPADVLRARAALARRALLPHVDGIDGLAAGLEGLIGQLDLAGRPLAAAHAALAPPDDPVTRLWHVASVLREYRGDGHVAALVAADVDGAQANVWHAAGGHLVATQRELRGWTETEWDTARHALRNRGWLDATATLTPLGRSARADVEHRTDGAAAHAFAPLADDALHALQGGLVPIATSIVRGGAVPYPNAIGVPAPALAAAP